MSCLLRLMLLLMVPFAAFAAPLQAVLVGDYRPLKAAEAEPVADGFEASWLAGLGEMLDGDIVLVDGYAQADLRIGAVGSGATYYSSEIAGLTAAETGPAKWSELAGKPFCVAEGSPHAAVVVSRFGGVARTYPSAAQALIGLKLGECQAVVGDRLLLQPIAALPEWRRYNRLLPALEDAVLSLRIEADDAALQQRIERVVSGSRGKQMLADVTQHWVDEVAFQAYVLADTLDCH
ncbi:amino acid ABC transporter substrate-binding protein [Stutzerimonas stutzeri]|uniref:Amino acid ABC transporter substrate-binding protein n=1 Tax=Stutzerimonas stutzeri TaxID=316 RepID=W8RSX1_STUST|nr:transporter substrate-binding domain-containing protein [Stutzerimonas stutzeri]AHL75156.1 amino acid ABC transporter substrate-binding protein [Stutzerimonas stutzeri]MCQ4328298.1 transporter substrate-binding domain-containing protein [Stutzerimonas stutzeri]